MARIEVNGVTLAYEGRISLNTLDAVVSDGDNHSGQEKPIWSDLC